MDEAGRDTRFIDDVLTLELAASVSSPTSLTPAVIHHFDATSPPRRSRSGHVAAWPLLGFVGHHQGTSTERLKKPDAGRRMGGLSSIVADRALAARPVAGFDLDVDEGMARGTRRLLGGGDFLVVWRVGRGGGGARRRQRRCRT